MVRVQHAVRKNIKIPQARLFLQCTKCLFCEWNGPVLVNSTAKIVSKKYVENELLRFSFFTGESLKVTKRKLRELLPSLSLSFAVNPKILKTKLTFLFILNCSESNQRFLPFLIDFVKLIKNWK